MAFVAGPTRSSAPEAAVSRPHAQAGIFDLLTEGPAQRLALFRGCCRFAIAGSLLAVLTALMPHEGVDGFRASSIVAVGTASGLVSLAFLLFGGRFPSAALERLTITGCFVYLGVFGLIVYLSGPEGGPTAAVGLLAVGLGSLFLFSRRTSLVAMVVTPMAYALVLTLQTGATAPLARWTVTAGLLCLTGVVVRDLIDRIHVMADAEKDARAEAEQIRAELEAASRHKSEFLAGMSHELRTPLNAIIGFSEVLGEELFGELNEKQAEYVDDVRTSGQHLLTLINDVLDLAKVEAGRMDLDLGPVELADVLTTGVARFGDQAGSRGITLEIDRDPGLGVVEADGRKLTQIVSNVVSNAVKLTPDGGRVRVTARRRVHAVEVAVTAAGPGIRPEDHGRIFEDFREPTARGRRPGNGLGLALAQRFVELHGGRIGVRSEPGTGATLWFSLPLRLPNQDATENDLPPAGFTVPAEAPTRDHVPTSMLQLLATADPQALRPLVTRWGVALVTGGSLIGLAAVVLGRDLPRLRAVPAGAGAAIGVAVALLIRFASRRAGAPANLTHLVPALCATVTAFATFEVFFAGPLGGPTAAQMYVCIGGGCFLMLSRRMAMGQLALIGAAYAAVLAAQPDVAAAPTQWMVVLGATAAVGTHTTWIAGRIRVMAAAEKEARAEAEAARAELEVTNRHKSEFLAGMSHELRTPLNAIIGFSEVLGEELFGDLNPKQAEYVDDVRTSGQHLLTLINDVLDLAKVEAGRMDLELAPLDLADMLTTSVALFREQASRHGIALSVELDPDLGVVEADARKVTQVVYNLVSNAVKFTSDGGRVQVSGRRRTHAVEVAVTDTGPGIAPEDHERVFEDFHQAAIPGRGRRPGTGLGLALARRFVELHGGRIGVESRPGEGTTAWFSLPLVALPTPSSTGPP